MIRFGCKLTVILRLRPLASTCRDVYNLGGRGVKGFGNGEGKGRGKKKEQVFTRKILFWQYQNQYVNMISTIQFNNIRDQYIVF